jgi:phosphoserine aminotransferase
MAERKVNFNPGPSTLPLPVLENVRDNMVDFQGSGMSFLELSHRSPEFMEIHQHTQDLLKELMGIPDNYKVLFMGGGASTQFALIPMNFLTRDGSADYVNTGTWSKKAIAEAKRFGGVNVAGDTSEDNFNHLPQLSELKLDGNARYLHITSNNTIFGTQFRTFPETGTVPLISDMSSDILSHKIDVSKFGMIYAGAQKNLGPAGVTVIILRDDMLEMADEDVPTMFSYKTHVNKDSMFNTPPTGPIYMVGQVLEWVKSLGGLEAVEQMNRDKATLLYDEIDADDFYRGAVVDPEHRSWMNVTMRLPSEELEKKFIADAAVKGLHGLKGHRSVGGIRASIYNAMPREGVERLVAFMKDFRNAS